MRPLTATRLPAVASAVARSALGQPRAASTACFIAATTAA
jgi:hypothetical protein